MPLTLAFPLRPSFGRMVTAALIGGVAAGVVATLLQQVLLVPLIFAAEALETASAHVDQGWAPAAGFERAAATLLFNCLAGVGFGMLLSGAYALRGGVTWRQGILWALAGFVSFSVAPALGLPPELPGAHAAGLAARQGWWIATAAATAGGLAGLAFGRLPVKLAAIALLAAPHIVGAPRAAVGTSEVPVHMAHAFAAGSLATSAVFWLVLGLLVAWGLARTNEGKLD